MRVCGKDLQCHLEMEINLCHVCINSINARLEPQAREEIINHLTRDDGRWSALRTAAHVSDRVRRGHSQRAQDAKLRWAREPGCWTAELLIGISIHMTIQYQFFGYTAVYCTRRLAASPRGSRSARLNERVPWGFWMPTS